MIYLYKIMNAPASLAYSLTERSVPERTLERNASLFVAFDSTTGERAFHGQATSPNWDRMYNAYREQGDEAPDQKLIGWKYVSKAITQPSSEDSKGFGSQLLASMWANKDRMPILLGARAFLCGDEGKEDSEMGVPSSQLRGRRATYSVFDAVFSTPTGRSYTISPADFQA